MINSKKLKKNYSLLTSIVITIVMTFSGINFSLSDGGIAPKISFGEKTYAVIFDPTVNIMPIQAGWYHNILLQNDGTVMSWGYNNYGQLGFGDTTNRSTPIVVAGLIGVKQVVASQNQSFALMNDGTVKSWGLNSNGQLGLGNTTNYSIPTVIPGLVGVNQLVAGGYFTFALMNDGTVKAWGDNYYGELGIGNTTNQYSPTVIPGLTGVKQLVAGDYHTLALMNDGTIKAWGYNGCGQLGLGDTTQRNTPTVIVGLIGLKQLATVQQQSFALMNDGTVKAWGYNYYGQLGIGNTTAQLKPTVITGLTGVAQIVAGYQHSLALMNDGTVKAWGYNLNGQLGLGNTTNYSIPTVIPGLSGVRQLTVGYDDSIALMKDSSIKVWGDNCYGQLGLGNLTNRLAPTTLQGINFFLKTNVAVLNPVQYYMANKSVNNLIPSISVFDGNNDNLTCKVYVDSEVSPRDTKTATNTISSQNISFNYINIINLTTGIHTLTFNVSDGTDNTIITSNFAMVEFDPTTKPMPIQCGRYYNLSLQGDGKVKAWGSNWSGQLGIGNRIDSSIPTVIPNLTGVKQLSAGFSQSFALMNDGTVQAWGYNQSGQLGIGNLTTPSTPTLISGLTGVNQISSGYDHTLALMSDGTVKSWGGNSKGQLGFGGVDSIQHITPTLIPGLKGVKQLFAGYQYTLALMNDGTVEGWGAAVGSYIPMVILGLAGVKQLAVEDNYCSFALMNDGSVRAWGSNTNGELGLGDTIQRTTPTVIQGLVRVIQIVGGNNHCMALMDDGTIKAWGSNNYGELGLGDTTFRTLPTLIPGLTGVSQLTAGNEDSIALLSDNTVKTWGYNVCGQLGFGDTISRLVPTSLSGMKFNNKANITISTQTQNYTVTGLEDSITPLIAVADVDNDNLTCSYYVDSETAPRDTKSVANTIVSQNVTFSSSCVGSLTQGLHTLTIKVNDGTDTTTVYSNFIINRVGTSVASSNITNSTVDLTLNDSFPNTTEYQITCESKYIDSQGNLTAYPTWIKLSNKKITVVGLTSGRSYSFQATVRNLEGILTPQSNTVTFMANAAALASPGNLVTAATSDTTIHSTWDSVSGADSYIVECDGVANGTVTTLYYDNFQLTPNTNHRYRVCAVRGGVSGIWSDYVQATTNIALPSAPQNIIITPAGTSILISWGTITGASDYDIEVDGNVQANGMKTRFRHSNLKPLTSHTYRVRAKNLGGAGTWSQLQTIMTTGGLPGLPSNIIATPYGTKIDLNWSDSVDAESYEVVKVVNGIEGQTFEAGSSNTFENNGLNYNSSYTYKIRGINSIGAGVWSSPITVTTCGLDTPQNINTTETDNSIAFTWDKVNGATNYEMDIKKVLDTGDLILVRNVSGIIDSNYNWTGLEPETEYSITIKAISNSGESDFSEKMTVVTLPIKPTIPQNVNAMISDNIITITWDLVDGAQGYDVELDGVVLENDISNIYTNNELMPSEVHTYRVRARNTAIEGEWSNLQSIKTLPGKALAPSGIIVKATQTGATISWDPIDSATVYDIEIFDGTKTYVVENITKTTFTHRRISLNTECRYRIRTKNVEGTSDWSEYIINNAIKAIGTKNNTLDLGLTATDVTDFSPYTMVVTYNPGVLNVVDLCTITGKNDLSTGKIDGTDVTIKEFTPGRIVFSVDKVVTPGEAWTGIVNSIKFMSKSNGGTTITYTVFYNLQQ